MAVAVEGWWSCLCIGLNRGLLGRETATWAVRSKRPSAGCSRGLSALSTESDECQAPSSAAGQYPTTDGLVTISCPVPLGRCFSDPPYFLRLAVLGGKLHWGQNDLWTVRGGDVSRETWAFRRAVSHVKGARQECDLDACRPRWAALHYPCPPAQLAATLPACATSGSADCRTAPLHGHFATLGSGQSLAPIEGSDGSPIDGWCACRAGCTRTLLLFTSTGCMGFAQP
jgi:hypothetical protein